MDTSGSSASWPSISPPASSSKRLIFDRRYGWVCDEWKEPSKEALAGGRGMFCILPIAKGVIDMAARTICDLNVLGNPELLSPEALLATVGDQFQKFTASIRHSPLNSYLHKGMKHQLSSPANKGPKVSDPSPVL